MPRVHLRMRDRFANEEHVKSICLPLFIGEMTSGIRGECRSNEPRELKRGKTCDLSRTSTKCCKTKTVFRMVCDTNGSPKLDFIYHVKTVSTALFENGKSFRNERYHEENA